MATTTVTRMGETWDMISYRVLGDEHYIKQIMDLNPTLRHVARFPQGVEVTVPQAVSAVADSSLPPWKRATQQGGV